MTRTKNFLRQNFFERFSENHFFSTIYVTLIIMSRKYFFDFRSPDLPFDLRFWTRGFLLVMRSRKAGLPCATRARKRELSIQEVRPSLPMSVQVRHCPSKSAIVRPSPPMSVQVRQCPSMSANVPKNTSVVS